jgi:hypothetical protein
MKRNTAFLFIALLTIVFFWQFFTKGLIPIPADNIVGLYHPFRDLYSKEFPNGIPFKNFLITDPVRQQYPWKELTIASEKKIEMPLWNPYNFAGTPLLANFQSGSFYFLNILFWIVSFSTAWNLIVILGPLLSAIFLYSYLDNLKLIKWASLLGAITFSFSGFFVAWMEWGNITHVTLWLPLVLLSIDKIVSKAENKKNTVWIFIYLFSLISAFFAGHLQFFFYLFIISWIYLFAKILKLKERKKIILKFLITNLLFIIATSFQWIPTFQFILLSARNADGFGVNNPGWFIPWQHLIQFVAPDFFGNPSTLNYWGEWNYGEFVGYVGIIPLIFAMFGMFYRKDKKTLLFGSIFFVSLIFALPNFVSKIPFLLHVPFVETSQPTRLLFLVDFSLAVLAALGFDYYTKEKKRIVIPLLFVGLITGCIWVFAMLNQNSSSNFIVAKNNLKLPSVILFASAVLLLLGLFFKKLNIKFNKIIYTAIILLTMFDLFRFGWKFIPFAKADYLFPQTKIISFLQKQRGHFRIMSADSRIFPPNFPSIYRIESIDGYDPLYIRRYGELIAAIERNKPDINTPFGFNRIITPHNYDSRIMDLLGVKYVLSLAPLNSSKLSKVLQEGQTIVYENKKVLPRVFFVKNIKLSENKEESVKILFDSSIDLSQTGIVENEKERVSTDWSVGSSQIIRYGGNEVVIDTENKDAGFLVLTDSFYPTWKAFVDNKPVKIFITDYNFRGIVVPLGKHNVRFHNSLF